MDVKDEKFVGWLEAKKMLMENEKNRELGYEQKNALGHLRKFCRLNDKKAKKIEEKLGKIEKLRDRHIIYIMNFLPVTLDDLRILFANERVVLTDNEKKKIIEIVKANK